MTNLKKVLVNQGGLEITFFVDEGIARVEFRSNGAFSLGNPEDVILFLNGTNVPVVSHSEGAATAHIGAWEPFAGTAVSIMTRVGEFFDGWELP